MKEEGLFESTYTFYILEALKLVALFFVAFYIVFTKEQTLINLLAAAYIHACAN
jgi:hypothetical protein